MLGLDDGVAPAAYANPPGDTGVAAEALPGGLRITAQPVTEDNEEDFMSTMTKEGGETTHPDPDNPDVTLTEWPEEGLSRISSKPIEEDSNGNPIIEAGEWYCQESIPLMKIVSGGLQWGGSMTCEGDYSPSYIKVTLQDTCAVGICVIWETKAGPVRSSSSDDYRRVSVVSRITPCDTTEARKIRVRMDYWIDGTQWGPRWHPDYVMNCHIK